MALGEKTLEKLWISSASGDFTVGETVTGGTSGATAVISYYDASGDAYMDVIRNQTSGTFQVDETITGGTSSETATVDGWIKKDWGTPRMLIVEARRQVISETDIVNEPDIGTFGGRTVINMNENNTAAADVKVYTGEAGAWKNHTTVSVAKNGNDDARLTTIGYGLRITGTKTSDSEADVDLKITIERL